MTSLGVLSSFLCPSVGTARHNTSLLPSRTDSFTTVSYSDSNIVCSKSIWWVKVVSTSFRFLTMEFQNFYRTLKTKFLIKKDTQFVVKMFQAPQNHIGRNKVSLRDCFLIIFLCVYIYIYIIVYILFCIF